MAESLGNRLIHAWNAFRNRDPTFPMYGYSSPVRNDRVRRFITTERTIINSIYNRIALDVAGIDIKHVRLDENKMFEEEMDTSLNDIFTVEANLDQTHRAFIQDVVLSMFDEGAIAMIPVETTDDPDATSSYDILTMRTGKIVNWYPQHVRIRMYNDLTGMQEEATFRKDQVAIIENPFYAVMNEANSTLKRLLRKLSILDAIDEQSGSGKLDLIIQLPYVIKSPQRREQAERRRKDIEVQLSGSKYGIAYTDGTERVTQLNRPAENNLMTQIQYLTSQLFSQLGATEAVFNGTADEKTMLNYRNQTVVPILNAIVDETKRKFITKTARTQRQSIMYFQNPFTLVPVTELANIADKVTRNEIMTPNEFRPVLGLKPSTDPEADILRNRNITKPKDETETPEDNEDNQNGSENE